MGNNGGAIKMPPQMSPPQMPPPYGGGMAGMLRNAQGQAQGQIGQMGGGQPPAPPPGGGRPGMMGNFRRQMGQMGGGQPPPPNPQMAMAQGLRRGGGMRMR